MDYRHFTAKAQVEKDLHTLEGLIKGITIDDIIDDDEIKGIKQWFDAHFYLTKKKPFSDMYNLIQNLSNLNDEDRKDIVYALKNISTKSEYYNKATTALQVLMGILHGINIDNTLTDTEVVNLQNWLKKHDELKNYYPYDELIELLEKILEDNIITQEEKAELQVFCSSFIDKTKTYAEVSTETTLSNIYDEVTKITFEKHHFCITGESEKASRKEISNLIEECGGKCGNLLKSTNYLIVCDKGNEVWAYATYGRKVEKALALRKKGSDIKIIPEKVLWGNIT